MKLSPTSHRRTGTVEPSDPYAYRLDLHRGAVMKPPLIRRVAMSGMLTVILAALLLVSGCGAGLNAQTSREYEKVPGADASAGPFALRDLMVPYRAGGYPRGSDVPLVVRVSSDSQLPTALTGVTPVTDTSSVRARHVVLHGPAGSRVTALPRHGLAVGPQGRLVLVPGSGRYLVAQAITSDLRYEGTIGLRFTFDTGDSAVVDVPMAPPGFRYTG